MHVSLGMRLELTFDLPTVFNSFIKWRGKAWYIASFSGFSVGSFINEELVTNFSLENNLPTFGLNAPVILGTRPELVFDLPTVQCSITLSHAKNEGGRHGILWQVNDVSICLCRYCSGLLSPSPWHGYPTRPCLLVNTCSEQWVTVYHLGVRYNSWVKAKPRSL